MRHLNPTVVPALVFAPTSADIPVEPPVDPPRLALWIGGILAVLALMFLAVRRRKPTADG